MEGKLHDVSIRPARVDDATGIAGVHVASWREAYQSVLPADYLASLDPRDRTEQWRTQLSGTTSHTWVAISEAAGTVGFATLGDSRDEDANRTTLELHSIYLAPDMWGQGVARNLMRTVLEDVHQSSEVTLWALAANDRARQFYRRHGFVDDGVERTQTIAGVNVLEVRYRRK